MAFGLTQKIGTDCWWHLELPRKSWTESRSSHGLLVLEREASKKRGTSGKKLDAEYAGGRRGSGGGGKGGVVAVTRERSGVEITAGQAGRVYRSAT